MDPYLEGYLWPDVHNSLAFAIKELLAPQISPKYVARTELYTVTDTTPESEIGILYPDVEVLLQHRQMREPAIVYETETAATAPNIVISANMPITARIPVVEIRDVAQNRLITAIEILSPVNKKKPGSDHYHEKRMGLHRSGVHLLEIDLLRRGIRPLVHPMLPPSHYAALLMRAGSGNTEVWTINLSDTLPILPVPLDAPDPDALLDLRKALDLIYERSLYHLSIDYHKDPPPPSLTDTDRDWVAATVKIL